MLHVSLSGKAQKGLFWFTLAFLSYEWCSVRTHQKTASFFFLNLLFLGEFHQLAKEKTNHHLARKKDDVWASHLEIIVEEKQSHKLSNYPQKHWEHWTSDLKPDGLSSWRYCSHVFVPHLHRWLKTCLQPDLSSELQRLFFPWAKMGIFSRITKSTCPNWNLKSLCCNLTSLHCFPAKWLISSTKKERMCHLWYIPCNLPSPICCRATRNPLPNISFIHPVLSTPRTHGMPCATHGSPFVWEITM